MRTHDRLQCDWDFTLFVCRLLVQTEVLFHFAAPDVWGTSERRHELVGKVLCRRIPAFRGDGGGGAKPYTSRFKVYVTGMPAGTHLRGVLFKNTTKYAMVGADGQLVPAHVGTTVLFR